MDITKLTAHQLRNICDRALAAAGSGAFLQIARAARLTRTARCHLLHFTDTATGPLAQITASRPLQ